MVVTSLVMTQPLTEDFSIDQNFIDDAQEYVCMHLVDKLSEAKELIKSPEGRKWLLVWEDKRGSILHKILLYQQETTKKFTLYEDWFERLQRFQDLQKNFLKTIIDDYYDKSKSLPWPKIVLNVEKKRLVIDSPPPPPQHQRKNDQLESFNPVATESDIDQILRFHRPLSNFERLNEAVKKNSRDIKNLPSVDTTEEFYSTKEYYIINKEMIQNLQKTFYTLTRESFKGKRSADLDYQEALFHAERVTAQLDVWKKEGYDHKKDTDDIYFKQFDQPHLRLLSDDQVYTSFLNYEDTFFEGNMFEGYVDRYDNPTRLKNNFEITAEVIVGNRYKHLKELYTDMRKFEVTTKEFTQCDLKDLITIDSYLERFKTFTFWFSLVKLNKNQWFVNTENTEYTKKSFMIRPKNTVSQKEDEMFKEVSRTLKEREHSPLVNTDDVKVIFEKKNIQDQLQKQISVLKSNKKFFIKIQTFWANKMLHYLTTLERANLLQSFSPTPTSQAQQKSSLSSDQHDFLHLYEVPDLHSPKSDDNKDNKLDDRDANDKHQKNEDESMMNLKKIAENFEKSFNPNINALIMNVEQKSMPDPNNVLDHAKSDLGQNKKFGSGGDESMMKRRNSASNLDNKSLGDTSGSTVHKRLKLQHH